GTRRSIATTTVFCILSLTTRPTRVLRVFRSAAFWSVPFWTFPFWGLVISAMVHSLPRCLLLAQDGLQPRDVAADDAQPEGILKRLRRAAEIQPELLLLELADPRRDIVERHLANLISSHWS